jgi:hypothetical protein
MMMTDPAFAIRNEVLQLVDVQIDTLRKPLTLTPSELDEYHTRSEQIARLYKQLDLMAWKRLNSAWQPAAWSARF